MKTTETAHQKKDDLVIKDNLAGNLNALTDTKTLRKRAREHVEEGAVTTGYAADKDAVIQLLNAKRKQALVTKSLLKSTVKTKSSRLIKY